MTWNSSSEAVFLCDDDGETRLMDDGSIIFLVDDPLGSQAVTTTWTPEAGVS